MYIWQFVVGRDKSCSILNKMESGQGTIGGSLVTGHPCMRFFEQMRGIELDCHIQLVPTGESG